MLNRFNTDTLGTSLDRVVNVFFFILVPMPTNTVEGLRYYCLISMCVFIILPPRHWSFCPLPYSIYVPMFRANALGFRSFSSFPQNLYVSMPIVLCLTYHWYNKSTNAYVHTSVGAYWLLIMAKIANYTYLNSVFSQYLVMFNTLHVRSVFHPPHVFPTLYLYCCHLQRS